MVSPSAGRRARTLKARHSKRRPKAASSFLASTLVVWAAATAAAPVASLAAGSLPAATDCTVVGTSASETLVGTPGDDVICGLGGDDVLRGRAGDDLLRGGEGDDELRGGTGDDRMRGQQGSDSFEGGGGLDVASYRDVGAAVSVTVGTGANDGPTGENDDVRASIEQVVGTEFDDRLVGDSGVTYLYGHVGDDVLRGGGGPDRLFGGRGSDRLRAGGGNDDVYGERGPDTLDARDGQSFVDRVFCGSGNDTASADGPDDVSADCETLPGDHAPTDITLSSSTVAENQPVGTTVGTLAAVDSDLGGTHTFALVPGSGATDNASFAVAGTSLRTAEVFNFEAKNSYSIRIRVTDNHGGTREEAFTISVINVDDVPSAVNDTATVTEDSPAGAINVRSNDTDADGGPASIISVTQPANGTVVITGGGSGLTYKPGANYCNDPLGSAPPLPDTFTYTLSPGGSTATVAITVTCVDDAPRAVDDGAAVAEDSGAVPVDVLANDTDVDAGPISIDSVTQPGDGSLVITGGCSGLSYEPDPDYCNDPPGT